jgi:hypothetical protein
MTEAQRNRVSKEGERMATCTCGHDEEEHGGDPKYPGSSKCNIEGCDCVCWEEDEEAEEEESE